MIIDLAGVAEKVDMTIIVSARGFSIRRIPSFINTIYPQVEETCLQYGIPCCKEEGKITVIPQEVGLNSSKVAEKFYEYFRQNYKVRLIKPD